MSDAPTHRRTFRLTFEHFVIAAGSVVGFLALSWPLGDNTMLLHLRTGLDIWNNQIIPLHDPYSFTAHGAPWTDQSWLVEWSYGAFHAFGGWHTVLFEQMLMGGALMLLVGLTARTGSMARTFVPVTLAFLIGLPAWTARPALFGVLCFAALVFVVDRRHSVWWLLPIAWLWVNSHGSFPLGILWLVLTFAGSVVDERQLWKKNLKPLLAFCAGVLLGALNPLGWALLTFPVRVFLDRREVFSNILEWKSPDFHTTGGVVQLLGIALVLLVLLRGKPTWRTAFPVIAFMALALYSQRNLALLAIVVVPAMREALTIGKTVKPASAVSTFLSISVSALIALIAIGGVVRMEMRDAFNVDIYPVKAMTWLADNGLLDNSHRVAAQDIVGCYRIFLDGAERRVFIDDRYDMYPVDVAKDYGVLLANGPNPQEVLDKHNIDVVLWEKKKPLNTWLKDSSRWTPRYSDDDWAIYSRA